MNGPESGKINSFKAPSKLEKPNHRRWLGFIIAPALALAVYTLIPPESLNQAGQKIAGLSHNGRVVAATAALMATLWVTEALPLAVTALLPIVMLPILTRGAIAVKSVTICYGHDIIFLYMGGFIIALAMQKWRLHRRIALRTVLIIGTKPILIVAGFMVAASFLSMWVSNTATTVMMLPIAMSVVELVRRELRQAGQLNSEPDNKPLNFAICLMLGIAYAASIGGIGTPIGTGPNAMMMAFIKENYNIEISFVKWMSMTIPLMIVFLPIAWLLLTKAVFPVRIRKIPGGRELIHKELKDQGPMSRAEWMVLIVFTITALTWITRPLLNKLQLPGGFQPLAGLTDTSISITAAVVLFCLPVNFKQGLFVMDWKQARKLPWGILLLLGGGLALASAIKSTGVAEFIGRAVVGFENLPFVIMILLASTTVIFATELTSNTATIAAFGPIFAAVAASFGLSPALLLVPITIAASFAFMMPVATPPNAIVFASGEITIPQMCKAGFWLNIVAIALVMLLTYLVIIPAMATAIQ